MEALGEMLPGHLISLRGDTLARSQSLRYFFWGYLKAGVYKYRPATIEELKGAIRQKNWPIYHHK